MGAEDPPMKTPQCLLIGALLVPSALPLFGQIPNNCLETTYANNGGGAPGGAMFLDVTAMAPLYVTGLESNLLAAAGTAVGIEVWTTQGTYVGSETNPQAWTQVAIDDGTTLSAGVGAATIFQFQSPVILPAGTTGVALIATGSGHAYTNGNGSNQMASSVDGMLALDMGAASNQPFTGFAFNPRVWNGRLCHDPTMMPTGTPFCDPASNNSSGGPAQLTGFGGGGVGSGLHLEVAGGPVGQFGYFLVGTQAMDPGLVISQGELCLAASPITTIGRYNIPGPRNSTGSFDGTGRLENLSNTAVSGYGFDVPTVLPFPGSQSILAGDTYHFQLWYRDGMGVSNFSNGLTVVF